MYAVNEADRQDLFQEIIIQLWKAWPRFRGDAKFSTWLYRIAINTAITGLRKHNDFVTSYEPDTLPTHIADEQQGREEEQLAFLYRAVAQLNEVEKAIVMLYLEERSYEEMEDILGISQGTLRVKMNRIKEKIRRMDRPY